MCVYTRLELNKTNNVLYIYYLLKDYCGKYPHPSNAYIQNRFHEL